MASDASATVVSPTSRSRLVVASQGLEIQHLQDQLARKDRESHASLSRVLEDKAAVESELAMQQARCSRLESQLQLLGERLKDLEHSENRILTSDISTMNDLTRTAKEREEQIASMRDELRSLRIANSSLQQERDILLEQLGNEQRARETAERVAANAGGSPRSSSAAAAAAPTIETADHGQQTVDAVAYASVDDVLATVALDETVGPDEEIARLRDLQALEMQLDQYHRAAGAQHAANAVVVEQALQRKVEAELARLAAEQARYRNFLPAGATSSATAATSTSAPSLFFGPSAQQQPLSGASGAHHQPAVAGATATPRPGGLPSPVPPVPPEVSPSTVFSGASAGRPQLTPATSFVSQQQEELAALRSRLSDLQHRHDEVRGVKTAAAADSRTAAGLSQVSTIPRAAVGAHAAADGAGHYSPDNAAAAAYANGVPQPTPLSHGASRPLTRSAVTTAPHPSSVLDRMLRKAQH